MPSRILLVDDNEDFTSLLSKFLRSKGAEVLVAGTAHQGEEILTKQNPDLALVDVVLPDQSGMELVSTIKSFDEEIPIIMVSGYGDTKLVVDAIKAGASDYIPKPVENSELWNKIAKLLDMRQSKSTEKDLPKWGEFGAIIGKSALIRQLIRDISKVTNSDATVLLRGESGTGKGLVAEVIHAHSHRRDKPFVNINCAAIPENLLESELFGHEKGSFTGAYRDKEGKFELANTGTLFLDEIGELPPELQVKILRVLQGREFERVGGNKTIHVDVRVIAATNRNLEKAIQDHRFREDLFYRLNVLPMYIPALRERKEDIPLLVEHFFNYYCRKAQKHFDSLGENIIQQLIDYDWPGNIRELQNVLERAVVLGREPKLRLTDFIIGQVTTSAPPQAKTDSVTTLKDLEYRALLKALEQTGGNISRAAKILGIGRDTVYRRLKKYNIGLKRGKNPDLTPDQEEIHT